MLLTLAALSPLTLHADFYIKKAYAKNLSVRLIPTSNAASEISSEVNSTSEALPFSYKLLHNAGTAPAINKKELATIENLATDRPQFFYEITYDELNIIRKIEKIRTLRGQRSVQSQIWLRPNGILARIKEDIAQEVSYEVRFDNAGRITTIRTFILNRLPFSLVQRYQYNLTDNSSAIINQIATNNLTLPPQMRAALTNKNTPTKTINYYFNGQLNLQKIYSVSNVEILLEPAASSFKLLSYKTIQNNATTNTPSGINFQPVFNPPELPGNTTFAQEAPMPLVHGFVTLYNSNHKKLETINNTYQIQNNPSLPLQGPLGNNGYEKNDHQKILLRSVSSKNLLTEYHYDKNNLLTKKTVKDTVLGITKKEFSYEYQNISADNNLLFTKTFAKNSRQRGAIFLANEPLHMEEMLHGFFELLVGIKQKVFKGKAQLEIRKKLEGNRIFSYHIKDGRITNLSIANISGRVIQQYNYSYYKDGRIFEEQQQGFDKNNFFKVRYIYDANANYQNYAQEVLKKKNTTYQKRLLAALTQHRVGPKFLGKSLLNYLFTRKKTPEIIFNKIKSIQNLFTKNEIKDATEQTTENDMRKLISEDEIVLAHMQQLLQSGLIKILFINQKNEVISYVRIEKTTVAAEEEKQSTQPINNPFAKSFNKNLLSFIAKQTPNTNANRQALLENSLIISNNNTEAQINNEAAVLNSAAPTNANSIGASLSARLAPPSPNSTISTTQTNADGVPFIKANKPVNILRFTYYGKEPVFFFDKRHDSTWFKNRTSVINEDANEYNNENAYLLNSSGRQTFRTASNDQVNLFAEEKILERYEFYFVDSALPFEAKHQRFDGKEAELREVTYFKNGNTRKKTYRPSFYKRTENIIINTPLLAKEAAEITETIPNETP